MRKIIFLDVDGTLLTAVDGKQYIPESALNAMKETRKAGNLVYLCTGRSLFEIGDLQYIGIDGIVGAAGAYIEKEGKEIYHSTFTYEQAVELTTMLDERGIGYTLECNDGLYSTKTMIDTLKVALYNGEEGEFVKLLKPVEEANLHKINKLTFISTTMSYDEIISKVDLENYSTVRASWGEGYEEAGEIAQKDISKATAINTLLETYEPLESFGVGDSMNDLEMFRVVDHPIAMGNSSHGVEKYAEFITKDLLDDGIEYAFKHYKLI